uniref:Uncharacterized protein n=1 Tax=Strongyloides papillosus TaxID=174720 RepID=A0A0N5C9H2_STREA
MEKLRGRPVGSKNRKTLFRETRSKAASNRKSFPDIEDELPPFSLPDTSGLKRVSREASEKSENNEIKQKSTEKNNIENNDLKSNSVSVKKSLSNIEDELPPCSLPDTSGLRRISRIADEKSQNGELQEELNEKTIGDARTPAPKRLFSNIFRNSTIKCQESRKRKESSIGIRVSPRKIRKVCNSPKVQEVKNKTSQKTVPEKSIDLLNLTTESINDKKKNKANSKVGSAFERSSFEQNTEISNDNLDSEIVDEIEESDKTIETYKKKYESCRVMLIKERKKNESKRESQVKELELLKKQSFESSIALTKAKIENDKLKKECEKLKIALQNSNQVINKSQDIISQLRKKISEKDMQVAAVNKQIENYEQNQPSLRKGGKTFSRETKLYVFSMLERCISYENIDYTLKRSIKCFLNRELDDCISRRTFYKWTKEFKICSLCISGYLLEEFIKKNGKGVLFHDEATLKNEKLQIFVLCGNADGIFYEILLGAVEAKDKSTESTIEMFEKLIGSLAKVTKSFKFKFLQDTYNSIYGYLSNNIKTEKISYDSLSEIANRGKDPNEIRKYVTYSCVSYIGSDISKTIEKSLHNLSSGQETLNILKQLSKDLCIKSYAYRPIITAFRISTEDEERETSTSESNFTFIIDDDFQICKIIYQDINYTHNEILNYSKINNGMHELCKKVAPILQSKEIINVIAFTLYLHELFIFPIVRAGESSDIRQFLRYMKHLTEVIEIDQYSKLLDVEKIKAEFGDNYNIFKYEILNALSKMIKSVFEDNSVRSEKEKMIKVLKETVEDVKNKFINVYEKIVNEENYSACSIKTQTTIIAEHIFQKVRHNSSKSPYKDMVMKSAQVAASYNNMTEMLESISNNELDDIFDRVKVLTCVVENDFKDLSESVSKDKMDTCSKLTESCERRNTKLKVSKFLNEQLGAKETIKAMEEINEILAKLLSQNQKEKFLRHQLRLWKKDKNSIIEVPKMSNETDKYQRVYKQLQYCVNKFNDSIMSSITYQNYSHNDDEESSDESSGYP